MAVKVAQEWLAICGGCEVTILDLGEALLDVLPKLEFVHMPVLHDHKLLGQTGEGTKIDIPQADVGLISGSIHTKENEEIAREMRAKCKTLIAMGACACYGGVPALRNLFTVKDVFEKVYRGSVTTEKADDPKQELPPLTDRVMAVSEVVKVDLMLPGCPTTPDIFAEALTSLLTGSPFKLSDKSVCDDCPTKREKKAAAGMVLKRPLMMLAQKGADLAQERCFMEQGFLCQGPATRSGCGGKAKTPRCVKAYMPCRGCFGPLRHDANPMVDMMGALSTIGIDPKGILDRAATFNRFAGGQNRLRPMPAPKK
ncbi:MAG: methyl viologen-reducing hydrogenase [Myxococcota bacterium]|nr:methyl viologen-reducing hydrogenase [Myxococcota bacterium]